MTDQKPALPPDIRVIRSARRTLTLRVTLSGVEVRAPMNVSQGDIARFVARHASWILQKRELLALRRAQAAPKLTPEELQAIAVRAAQELPPRVAYYARLMNVSYGRVTIRAQKTRWGSYSSHGNISLNCLLAALPPELSDYVIVHELCHRLEMNHSPRFWALVRATLAGCDALRARLKSEGAALIQRL